MGICNAFSRSENADLGVMLRWHGSNWGRVPAPVGWHMSLRIV